MIVSNFVNDIILSYFSCSLHINDYDEQAVQEYNKRRVATSKAYSPSGDAVLITKADLEGYHSNSDDAGKELAIVARGVRARPMIARLSCLFASLKVSGGYGPVSRQLSEARAC